MPEPGSVTGCILTVTAQSHHTFARQLPPAWATTEKTEDGLLCPSFSPRQPLLRICCNSTSLLNALLQYIKIRSGRKFHEMPDASPVLYTVGSFGCCSRKTFYLYFSDKDAGIQSLVVCYSPSYRKRNSGWQRWEGEDRKELNEGQKSTEELGLHFSLSQFMDYHSLWHVFKWVKVDWRDGSAGKGACSNTDGLGLVPGAHVVGGEN